MPQRNGLDPVINVTLCVPQHERTCICTQRHEIEMQIIWYRRKTNLWWNCFREWTCFTASHPFLSWLFLFSWAVQPLQSVHYSHLPLIKNGGWFTFQNKTKEEVGREEKEAKDRFEEPAGAHALPNGISTLHPTALQWPDPGPARSNVPAACLIPRRASLVLQPSIPRHQKDQSHTA